MFFKCLKCQKRNVINKEIKENIPFIISCDKCGYFMVGIKINIDYEIYKTEFVEVQDGTGT